MKVKSMELFRHLTIEAMLSYYHFSRAMKCRNKIERSNTRLIEDMQSALHVCDKDLADRGLLDADTLIIAIRERKIVESRKTFEHPLEDNNAIEIDPDSRCPERKKDTHDSEDLSDHSLYGHYRREELMCYHHLVKVLHCRPQAFRSNDRLLEDIESTFCIPKDRITLEKIIAEADPVVNLIRRHDIVGKRAMFEGRNLDDSYTLPDIERDRDAPDGSLPGGHGQLTNSNKDVTVDQLCMQIMQRRSEFQKGCLNSLEWSTIMDKSLARLEDMKQVINTRVSST